MLYWSNYPLKQENEVLALNASAVIKDYSTYLAELSFKAASGEILTVEGNFCWKQNIILWEMLKSSIPLLLGLLN